MNQPVPQPVPNIRRADASIFRLVLKWMLANRHFLIASTILAVTFAGWTKAKEWLNLTTLKIPVPWPAGVTVGEDFRLLGLADGNALEAFGPFKRVRPNDELIRADANYRNWEILRSSDLESLKIGTVVDETRRGERQSNWYMVRLYQDTRPGAAIRAWWLELYYYTGEADTVPHIPDICAQAGGADILGSRRIESNVPTIPGPWEQRVPLHRTEMRLRDGTATAAYFTFSMNGDFSDDRLEVRWKLLNPFVRHAYFAKVQFSPAGGSADAQEIDRAAEEFMRHALPTVLKALPSSGDVKALER